VSEVRGDLEAMAADEMERALTLSWRDLAAVVPWGDAFDGFTPAGRQVTVERSYLWSGRVGGDILCEVFVYGGPSRWDEGVRLAAVVASGERVDEGKPAG
jgi:hypothetical protein